MHPKNSLPVYNPDNMSAQIPRRARARRIAYECPIVKSSAQQLSRSGPQDTYYACRIGAQALQMNTPSVTAINKGACSIQGLVQSDRGQITLQGVGDRYTPAIIDAVCGPRNPKCPVYRLRAQPQPSSLRRSGLVRDFVLSCPRGRILLPSPGRPCEIIKPGNVQYGRLGAELIVGNPGKCILCSRTGADCPRGTHSHPAARCGDMGTHACLPCSVDACPQGTVDVKSRSCSSNQHVCLPCTREPCPWNTTRNSSTCEFGTHICVPN